MPLVEVCSAIEQINIEVIWEKITVFKSQMDKNGWLQKNRSHQSLQWMHSTIQTALKNEFYSNANVKSKLEEIEGLVDEGKISALNASRLLLELFGK